MRDISAIKAQAEKREAELQGKPAPVQKIVARQVKSPSLFRNQQNTKDESLVIVLEKDKTSQKLTEVIKKKRKELETTAEATKSLLAGASQEADRLVVDAQKLASGLITQTQSDRNLAKTLAEQNKAKVIQLQEIENQLKQREDQCIQNEKFVAITTANVNKQRQNVDNLWETTSAKHQMVVDTFSTCVALLHLSSELLSQIQKVSSEVGFEVSQTLSKTGTMIERTAVLIKEIDADKSLLQTKAHELQKKEEGLVDREQMLDRTAKEVQRMKGQK